MVFTSYMKFRNQSDSKQNLVQTEKKETAEKAKPPAIAIISNLRDDGAFKEITDLGLFVFEERSKLFSRAQNYSLRAMLFYVCGAGLLSLVFSLVLTSTFGAGDIVVGIGLIVSAVLLLASGPLWYRSAGKISDSVSREVNSLYSKTSRDIVERLRTKKLTSAQVIELYDHVERTSPMPVALWISGMIIEELANRLETKVPTTEY